MAEPIASDAAGNLSDDERELVAAGTAQDSIEADLLRGACEEAGIVVLIDEARGGMVEKLSNPSAAWTLRVPAADLDRARKLIAETRAAVEADPDAGARAAEDAEAAEEASDKAAAKA